MPAGLDHTVVASCACAAPPAYALPNPDPDVSLSWKPAAWAIIGPQAHAKATISARPQAAMVDLGSMRISWKWSEKRGDFSAAIELIL